MGLRNLALVLGLTSIVISAPPALGGVQTPTQHDPLAKCADVVGPTNMTREEQWRQAEQALRSVIAEIEGSEVYVRAIATIMVAREFLWLHGDPGGAKTLIARMLFKAALKAIPNQDKKDFVLQFHKLLQEGVITGFPKIKNLLDKGRYEINTSTSLVGDKFIFLIADEAENANPATLSALLSVLNERAAFHGNKVVQAALASGVFTSNSTMAEFLGAAGDDRAAREALADRVALTLNMPNQTSIEGKVRLYQAVERARRGQVPIVSLPLKLLEDLAKQVTISPELYTDIAELSSAFDTYGVGKTESRTDDILMGQEVAPYFPANQFSTRSMLKIVLVLKASHLVDQLLLGRPLSQMDWRVTRRDLHLLAQTFAYGGPAQIRPKRLSVEISGIENLLSFGIPMAKLTGEWDPYNDLLYVRHPLDNSSIVLSGSRKDQKFNILTDTSEGNWSIQTDGLYQKLESAEAAAGVVRTVVEFEVDNGITSLLGKKTWPSTTREELNSIQEDAGALVGLINAQITKPAKSPDTSDARKENLRRISSQARSRIAQMRADRNSPEKLRQHYFAANREAYIELCAKFPDAAHYIKSIFTALASSNHVFAFGGPGGAKTLIARLILDAEIKSVNHLELRKFAQKFLATLDKQNPRAFINFMRALRQREPGSYHNFFLQFNKLTPEGRISGFQKMNRQIEDGVVEMNFDDSLASKKVLTAILDEVNQANPAVLSASLSILNEREAFSGSETFKVSLVTAIMTSNKLPSEIVAAFGEDWRKGLAMLDRVMNKVYVANKITDLAQLAQFLFDVDHGLKVALESPLSLSVVRPLVDKVVIPTYMLTTISKIHEKFMEERLIIHERSKAAHQLGDPHETLMTALPSNRTFVALLDQFKARILVEQMLSGVALENLRFTAQIDDLKYLFEGFGTWGPVEIKSDHSSSGIMHLTADVTRAQTLINSTNTPRRQKAALKDIEEEATTFVRVTNEVVQTFVVEFRSSIARYPHLFPTLFGSPAALKAWMDTQSARPAP